VRYAVDLFRDSPLREEPEAAQADRIMRMEEHPNRHRVGQQTGSDSDADKDYPINGQ
jgi:hypothetical protein